jgi:hypothetical protein
MIVRETCAWILKQAESLTTVERCPRRDCRCNLTTPPGWPWRVVPPQVREGESGWIYETDPPRFVEGESRGRR